jgi:carbamoylphosphate synthase large subunit
MGLPFQCSYESAVILQDKGLFRKFLADNNFNVPHAKRYENVSSIPAEDYDFFCWPVIVKPVDSAGSKGVTKVESPDKLDEAIRIALDSSLSDSFIIEDFLTFDGYHSSADPFTVDGKLQFVSYSDQLFDPTADNPYTPAMIIWQSTMKQCHQDYLTAETQRLMDLLGMKHGIYNIETCVSTDGKPYIMEVSPRGGGCKIAELQRMAYGVDLIENEVRKALGMPLTEIKQTQCDGHWCEMIVHANIEKEGLLEEIVIDPVIMEKHVKVVDFAVKKGDLVKPFTGANMSLGDIFLRFDSRAELDDVMKRSNDWLKVILQ